MRWPLLLGFLAIPALLVDEAFVRALNPNQEFFLDAAGRWFDRHSTRTLLVLFFLATFASFLVARLKTWRSPTVAFVIAWTFEQITVTSLKKAVGRPRPLHPEGIAEFVRPMYDKVDFKSFPSGHSGTAVLCAVVFMLWIRRPRLGALALAFAATVCVSRCYVAAHYLSDILAGAAIGWASAIIAWKMSFLARPHLELWRPNLGAKFALCGMAAVIFGWLLPAAPELQTIAAAGVMVPELSLHRPWSSVLFEPIVGPALEISAWPDLKIFLFSGAAWFVIAAALWTAWRRRRAWPALAFASIWAVAVVAVALSGSGQGPRLVIEEGDGAGAYLIADLQSHLDDPTDGAMAEKKGLTRFQRLGFQFIQPTWHNVWKRGTFLDPDGSWSSAELYGMEWSRGGPADSPLHLLIFNRRPEPADLGQEDDLDRLLDRAQRAGALVFASHPWRGEASQVDELWRPEHLSRLSGAEVRGRQQELDPALLRRQERLIEIMAAREKTLLVGSDFHGKRSANYSWMLIPSFAGEAPADAVWRALSKAGSSVVGVTVERRRPPESWWTPARPLYAAYRYFRGMDLRQRGAWMIWLILLALAFDLWPRRHQLRRSSSTETSSAA